MPEDYILEMGDLESKDAQKLEPPSVDENKDRISASFSQSTKIQLEWNNVHYTVNKTKSGEPIHILKGMSGVARAGQLLAIMGASGAGKTTLLNALAGRINTKNATLKAQVLANGKEIDTAMLAPHCAYVQQQDTVLATFSPWESMMFSAQMQLPRSVSAKEKQARVDATISDLGLEKCQHSLVGDDNLLRGISGGEKKRTSIGIELVTDPSVLFVDEPTSGLDSETAYKVVEKLRNIAHEHGRTVITTIHQPSSDIFHLFDNLLLMVEGETIFMGAQDEALDFFKAQGYNCPAHHNPSDFFMKVMNTELIHDPKKRTQLVEANKSFVQAHNWAVPAQDLPTAQRNDIPWYTAMYLLCQRSVKHVLRQPELTKVRFMQTLFMAFFVALVYYGIDNDQRGIQDRTGSLFFITTNNVMMSVLSVVMTFPSERVLYEREQANNMYSTGMYFLSKTIAELPFQTLYPVMFSLIVYFLIGYQNEADRLLIFMATNIMAVNVGQSLGMLVGSAVPNPNAAVSLTPIVMIPFMLFAGLFVNTDNIPVYFTWIEHTSLFKYCYEILVVNEFEGLEFHCTEEELADFNGNCPVTNGSQEIELLGIDEDSIAFNFGMLVVLMIGFRLMAYGFLKKREK